MWIITALWKLAYSIALWICMHYCNVHPSQDLWGRMAEIKHTVSGTFIKGYVCSFYVNNVCSFYVNRLFSVEKMLGMRKGEGMWTICSWLESWDQRVFKVIAFTVSGQWSAPCDVNGNVPVDWESRWWDLLKIDVDFIWINKSSNKFHRFNVDFYFLRLFWRIRSMVHDQVQIYVWLRGPKFTSVCVNKENVALQEKNHLLKNSAITRWHTHGIVEVSHRIVGVGRDLCGSSS